MFFLFYKKIRNRRPCDFRIVVQIHGERISCAQRDSQLETMVSCTDAEKVREDYKLRNENCL